MHYYLRTYDNFDYMDENEAWDSPKTYGTLEAAIDAAKRIVIKDLLWQLKPGMDSEALLQAWRDFGSDPAVMPPPVEGAPHFSAWEFAGLVAPILCGASDYRFTDVPTAYQQAIVFAARWHETQNQKVPGTELPYVVHLSNVAMEVMQAAAHTPGFDLLLAVQAALLHDVLEDTPCTFTEVEERFGLKVALAVLALTKPKQPQGQNQDSAAKHEQMEDSLSRIRYMPKEVWAVKLADRITNLQPPPPHWTKSKALAYRDEARLILETLGAGNEWLGKRLGEKIEAYGLLIDGREDDSSVEGKSLPDKV